MPSELMHQILRGIFEEFNSKNFSEFLAYLPPDLRQHLSQLEHFPKPCGSLVEESLTLVHKIHYSWFAKVFENKNLDTLVFYLPFFESKQREGLLKILNISPTKLWSPPAWCRFFFAQTLYGLIKEADIVPMACLAPSNFNDLLFLEKKRLIRLIDYLGIHSLAPEIHKIVDRKVLEKIYTILSKNQIKYLKQCLKQIKGPIASKHSMKLNTWDGNANTLKLLLHKKGLKHLALGLKKESPSLRWYLSRFLDIGRGQALQRQFEKIKDRDIPSYQNKYLLNLIAIFSKQAEQASYE